MNTTTVSVAAASQAKQLTAHELSCRADQSPDYPAELLIMRELSTLLTYDPNVALRRCLEIARHFCHAGTAGLSLLENERSNQSLLHWKIVTGVLTAYEGVSAPRSASMCGLCLDSGTTMLMMRPEMEFAYLCTVKPLMTECLLVPLFDQAKRPLGTFWIAQHEASSRFCVNDARLAEQLAGQAVLALALLEQARQHHMELALLESHEHSQQAIALGLAEQRRRRKLTEESEEKLRQALIFKDAELKEVHHRVKNSLQTAASLLMLQAQTATAADVALALRLSHTRLQLIAKVHQLLYKSANEQQVLMPKLLQTMGDALWQSFAEMSAQVQLTITAEPISLSPDDAILLALLANEVMTNAYKHAFPQGRSGELSVNLHCLSNDIVTLQIADNGIGMGDNPTMNGLGLELIQGFAAQLQGHLCIDKPADSSGTSVTVAMQRAPRDRHALKKAAVNSMVWRDHTRSSYQQTENSSA